MKEYDLYKNEYGFWQVTEYPIQEELEEYYKEKYYNGEGNSVAYRMEYDEQELEYFNERAKIWIHVINRFSSEKNIAVLEIGCGEGYSMNALAIEGYDIKGVDISADGLKRCNPHLLSYFEQGDTNILLKKYIENEKNMM